MSHNHLSRKNSTNGHLVTSNSDSYLGNSALCRFPSTKSCTHTVSPPQEVRNDDGYAENHCDGVVILMGLWDMEIRKNINLIFL